MGAIKSAFVKRILGVYDHISYENHTKWVIERQILCVVSKPVNLENFVCLPLV